ncbi:MAG: amylo-alpha-1,6-glucosidase [Bacteroidota bacterium]
MRLFVITILLLAPTIVAQQIDDLAITVRGSGRQYVFTNKEAGTYYGEVNAPNAGGWQGWFVNAEKILHDYSVTIKGKLLDRTTATTRVLPHTIQRLYPNGLLETVTLTDSLNVLLVQISDPSAEIIVQPAEFFRQDGSAWIRTAPVPDFAVTALAVTGRRSVNGIVYAVAADRSLGRAKRIGSHAAANADAMVLRRKNRMQNILDRSSAHFNDKRLTVALGWAKIQIDALIMNQATGGKRTKGIFAGLPWFNNYWGRDSFISLPGATYVIGNFSDAREVLRSFAAFQETDSMSANFGRIPNLATPQSVVYNTADGTPWFIRSLYEYVKYSGDTAIVRTLYPVIKRSIDGTIRHHTDSLGFLTHGDAETWMDAVGPNGPWSPRGNRAVDIQALWHHQLRVGMFCAEYRADYAAASRWKNFADKLENNFRRYFVDTASMLLFDHRNSDGSPSAEIRPNQIFAFDMAIPEDVRQTMVRTVLTELMYDHGTATLAQSDSNFHPYHEHPPYYVKDAAYHNGTIWTWLNGPVMYAATRYDLQHLVYPVTKNSVHQMLDRGCVGALSELLNVHTKEGESEPRLSGTYSQAWSLAEFVRSMYQDYLGVSIDLPSKNLRINPKLPPEISSFDIQQRIGTGSVRIRYARAGDTVTVILEPKALNHSLNVNYFYVFDNGDAVNAPIDLTPDRPLTIVHTRSFLRIYRGADLIVSKKESPLVFLRNFSDKKYFTDVSLALPDAQKNFPVLRGPSHPLLSHAQVRTKSDAARTLFSSDDAAGDDRGPSQTFEYPSSTHFKKGILDITRALFRHDAKNLYCTLTFNNLYDPGWHPEYGFQLTLAAIAINTGSGTQRDIGLNSGYRLNPTRAYDRMIVVGGGIRVTDGAGTILCEYIPGERDMRDPIGNVRSNSVEFAVPLEYLGTPDTRWKISILVGGQDDHGGAGIGEFRTVNKRGSEWQGGGKNNVNESNVYDTLFINP